MPAIAHIGIGFAAKKIAPATNIILLILAAELIEIIMIALWAAGIEYPPDPLRQGYAPWSHSLLMGLLWTALAAMITYLILRKWRFAIIIGALVFSHTLLDLIASPKTAFYPNDTAMPIFFDSSFSVGLGLWEYKTLAYAGELGILAGGLMIYIFTKLRIRKTRKAKLNEN
jgi:membrane-bound metal-dependent hydrolase YbcI (DUF457 family)